MGAANPAARGVYISELTIIVPTYNERENVETLIDRLDAVLAGISWEVLFVDDDSPDGTAALIKEIGTRDPRVRCLLRIGRRGLSSACIDGMLTAESLYIAVMDADLQHDEAILPEMLTALKADSKEIVIGSRYIHRALRKLRGRSSGARRLSPGARHPPSSFRSSLPCVPEFPQGAKRYRGPGVSLPRLSPARRVAPTHAASRL